MSNTITEACEGIGIALRTVSANTISPTALQSSTGLIYLLLNLPTIEIPNHVLHGSLVDAYMAICKVFCHHNF